MIQYMKIRPRDPPAPRVQVLVVGEREVQRRAVGDVTLHPDLARTPPRPALRAKQSNGFAALEPRPAPRASSTTGPGRDSAPGGRRRGYSGYFDFVKCDLGFGIKTHLKQKN